MSPYTNTVRRTFLLIADILASKPTDWNREGLMGKPAEQFSEVFSHLYPQGSVECLPVSVQHKPLPNGDVALIFRLANSGPSMVVTELHSFTINEWADQT